MTKIDESFFIDETIKYKAFEQNLTTQTTTNHPRDAIVINEGKIQVNEDKLSLEYRPEIQLPSWKPNIELIPYQQRSKLYLEIKTTGLNPNEDRIIMVGIMDDRGKYHVFTNPDEKVLLSKVWHFFNNNQPELLITHNGFEFDLPFLIRRWNKYKIFHRFKKGFRNQAITASSFRGQAIKCTPIYWSNTQIIDTFQQICIWDKQASTLTNYNLQSSVLALDLRQEERLELSNERIRQCWQSGNINTIEKYLVDDLQDTKLLADFLLPVIYYQMIYVPELELQQLAVSSPALKAQKIHENLYFENMSHIKADERLTYEGGRVTCFNSGLHFNVAKIDIASLYPSIMLRYGICSRKDEKHRFLEVMSFMTHERLKLKALAKNGDKQAGYMEKALKILINGSYGFLGTKKYSFNDYQAAALITAYGRKILDLMTEVVTKSGATVIEIDTDGIFFTYSNPQQVCDRVQEVLPDGLNVELELSNCCLYMPKAKNYVLVYPDGKTLVKGLFKKRDRYPLQRDFPVEFIKRYFLESPEVADTYYQEVRNSIKDRSINIQQLMVTRKIGKREKYLVEQGLGKTGDIVSFYITENVRFERSKEAKNNKGDYWIDYYLRKLDEQHLDIVNKMPTVAKKNFNSYF